MSLKICLTQNDIFKLRDCHQTFPIILDLDSAQCMKQHYFLKSHLFSSTIFSARSIIMVFSDLESIRKAIHPTCNDFTIFSNFLNKSPCHKAIVLPHIDTNSSLLACSVEHRMLPSFGLAFKFSYYHPGKLCYRGSCSMWAEGID